MDTEELKIQMFRVEGWSEGYRKGFEDCVKFITNRILEETKSGAETNKESPKESQ